MALMDSQSAADEMVAAPPGKAGWRAGPPRWLVAVAFAASAVPFALQIPNDLVIGYDTMKYMVAARSIHEGSGLNPGGPVASQYPPGWPCLVAAVCALTGWAPVAMHALNSLLGAMLGPLVYLCFRRRISPWVALLIGVYAAAHALTVGLAEQLISEPAFGVAFWALLLLSDWRRLRGGLGRGLALGAVAAVAVSMRTAGLAVWLGLAAHALARRAPAGEPPEPGAEKTWGWKRRAAELAGLAAPLALYLALAAWASPAAAVRTDAGYGSQFLTDRLKPGDGLVLGLARRTLGDFYYHVRDVRVAMLPVDVGNSLPALLPKLMVIAALLLAVLGWARTLRRRAETHPWITAAWLALCFVWPYFGTRFIWPVVPLLAFYALAAVLPTSGCGEAAAKPGTAGGGGWGRLGLWPARAMVGLLALAAAAGMAGSLLDPRPQRAWNAAHCAAFRKAVATAAAGGGPVATLDGMGVFYYDRAVPVCVLSWVADPAEQLRLIRRGRAAWLLGAQYTGEPLAPTVRAYPQVFRPVMERDGVTLYRIEPEEPGGSRQGSLRRPPA